ncbi:MAG TPA: hypothetical protein VGF04_08960 [Solirubrobacterales bacterium]|jgi:hypothetical protein
MRRLLAALALASALALSACGSPGDETPVACLEGAGAYTRALAVAPAEVRLEGSVPISDCLAENQTGGDLATAGAAMLRTATRLNTEARSGNGAAALRLGYLIGAARRGAEDTSGIHTDLIRRLEAAAGYSPGGRPLTAAFRKEYEEGLRAGSSDG